VVPGAAQATLFRAATQACNQLSNDVYTAALIADAASFVARREAAGADFTDILMPDYFEFFLGVEQRLLEAVGAPSAVIYRCAARVPRAEPRVSLRRPSISMLAA
jgi:hypothetical protein